MNVVAEHRLRNDLAEARQIGEWVSKFGREARLSDEVQHALDLSLVEWINNVIAYAYDDSRPHWITIQFQADDAEVRVEVADDGREFNPLTFPAPDLDAPLETRPVGGLGIYMMRKLMDTAEYRREGNRNILTLMKHRGNGGVTGDATSRKPDLQN